MGRFRGLFSPDPNEVSSSLFVSASPPSVDDIVKRFWEIEEPNYTPILAPDDSKCEKHFLDTHTRTSSGRYVVRLPFKSSDITLGNNRQTILSRIFKLEHRLSRQPQFYNEYNFFLKEYLDLGHMTVAKEPSSYIIPHHCVVKNDSSTTKLRVVFDASFKTSCGSLNDVLLPGPKLQTDIGTVILNFRRHPIVFIADISKMFRQIVLHPEDRKFVHIFWRFSPEDPVTEFELNTVTYGLSCAPYQAIRVIKQLVDDEGSSFPLASKVLVNDIYIDDIVSGAENVDKALVLQHELNELLKRGGFELRKWSSNCPKLLNNVPKEHHEKPLSLSSREDPIFKVLGLQWDPTRDCFSFSINPPSNIIYSKRAILSTIARIYDVLGFLSPVVFSAKCLLQELWQFKLDWDEELPPSIKLQWFKFIESLPTLSKVFIPRHILLIERKSCQILGFCDASQKGYAACIYLRIIPILGRPVTQLLKAKTKLAPLKTISVPRLELCGAVLLCRLLRSIRIFYEDINVDKIYLFTDSTIVLCWLKTSPHLLKTFVANRVSTILNLTSECNSSWYHVSTSDNPADCASRGLTPKEL